MSKHFAAVLLALPLILQIFNNCFSQDAEVDISIRSASSPIAEIRGRQAQSSANRNFSILREYAGFAGLADRVSDIHLEDTDGKAVAFKQFVPGEYVAEHEFVQWSYKLDLTPFKRASAAAHVSWINGEDGLLFLDDLLPVGAAKNCRAFRVKVNVPEGWGVFGNESLATRCSSHPVYFISRRARLSRPNESVNLAISGEWKFSDKQAMDFASEIYNGYEELFGRLWPGKRHVFVLPFPRTIAPENWEADTRGDSVVILSSDMPFQTQSVQRLHEQLRHEIFHWWIPNGISLKGNYDWFYEGFALYESLKFGVAVNRLRFDDFLDTLGRAMAVGAALPGGRSLIEASKSRLSGGDTEIYARGMLIAFLTDLKMLARTGGKRDVADLIRSIYQRYKDPETEVDGNLAVLNVIDDSEVERSVKNGEPLNWTIVLNAAGIVRVGNNGSVTLRVADRLSGSQKKLLDKLGYNNWRKAPVGSK